MSEESAVQTANPGENHTAPDIKPKPIKAEDVKTLLDFFRYGYQQSGRRLSLKKSVAKAMSPDEGLMRGSVDEVRALAQQDPDLKVPQQILATLDRTEIPPRLMSGAMSLLAAGVKVHPLMSLLLGRLEQGAGLDDALRTVGALNEEEVAERMGEGEWKGKRVIDVKANAISTGALLEAMTLPLIPDALARTLQEHLWRPALHDRPPPSERAALTGTPSLTTNGLIADIWQREVGRAHERAREAQELVRLAEENRDEARHMLATELNRSASLTEQITSLHEQITQLEADLAGERMRLKQTRTEGSYEYERLRARLQRRLKSDIELLQEGLHALRREKPHVMEDRAERALEALEAELAILKGGG